MANKDEKDLAYDLEEIRRRRVAREKKVTGKQSYQSMALARQFEEGISVQNSSQTDLTQKKIQKARFLEVLAEDLEGVMVEEDYSPEELQYIRKSISKMSVGAGSTLALECKGLDICPFSDRCPFARIGKEPIGKPCPLESVLFAEFMVRFMEEFKVDPSNIVEVSFCNELAETEILLLRVNKSLAKRENADMLGELSQMTKSGEVIRNDVVSPHLEVREKLLKRRERVIKLMVGDRQEKYKEASARKVKDSQDSTIIQSKNRASILDVQLQNAQKDAVAASDTNRPKEDILTPDDLLNSAGG
jgi:hypothetical protein